MSASGEQRRTWIVGYVHRHEIDHGQPPMIADIAADQRLSKSTAYHHLRKLVADGRLHRAGRHYSAHPDAPPAAATRLGQEHRQVVLDILAAAEERGETLNQRTVAARAGFSHPSVAAYHLRPLEAAGLVTVRPGRGRERIYALA